MPKRLLALGVLVLLPACGGGSSTPTPVTPATPVPPAQANVTVSYSSGVLRLSPLAAFCCRIQFLASYAESAGLGAHIDFIRMSSRLRGAELERAEFNANQVIAAAGSNVLSANGTKNFTAFWDINNSNFDSLLLISQVTDDHGNVLQGTRDLTGCGCLTVILANGKTKVLL